MSAETIGSADTVYHRPSKETWTVAVVRDGKLSPCGWPESLADLSDCELVEKATPAQREEMLQTWANMDGGYDIRKSWAKAAIAAAEKPTEGQ